MITFNSDSGLLKLDTKNSSYVIALSDRVLYHIYWGRKISEIRRPFDRLVSKNGNSFSALDIGVENGRTADMMPMEYPTYGSPDLRTPALHLRYSDGTSATALRYVNHYVIKGKPELKGLPSTYVEPGDEVETLSIVLKDAFRPVTVTLNYSVWYDYDAIARSVVIRNDGEEDISVLSANSAAFDMIDAADYKMMNLFGVWGRERSPEALPLRHGMQLIDSKRGASSHNQNPFIALLSPDCSETSGEIFGMNLVYSGNFAAGVELDGYNTARAFIGVNSFDFGYKLSGGEEFYAPEAVTVYSNEGIGGMSRRYHSLYRSRLCRGKFRDIERPVLINNWEATYFDFDEEKIFKIAEQASKLGIELFVLDDGWFGSRNTDNGSLGDWYVNVQKLPHGLSFLADRINGFGMKFGLWIEPEMVSPDSDLYRSHPDWCMHINGRDKCLGRNQYMLDLSREDVCDYIIESISRLLDSANIEYIKWDMNRNMSEIGSDLLPSDRQSEVAYRYILGLYRIMDAVTSRYPDVLLEGCSGGGGRFDPGMLYYIPQIWTSDVSDAEERLKIQYGTSIVYPFSTMGAHVSAVPNHQMQRSTPFKMRGDVAMMGQFGYELDINKLTEDEQEEVKQQIAFYKEFGAVMHRGDCYRIASPFEGDLSVMEFIAPDKNTVVVNICSRQALPNAPFKRIALKGLDEDAVYIERLTGTEITGSELCTIGIPFINGSEHYSEILVFYKK